MQRGGKRLSKLREMKITIQRFQNKNQQFQIQFQQEVNTFKRFRYIRNKYLFTTETLFEQIIYLQSQLNNVSAEKKEIYNFDDEKKIFSEKKTEFLFRRIMTGLRGQKYTLFLHEF